MKRSLTILIAAMFALAACGGGQSEGNGESAPPEPAQAEAPENGGDENVPEESASEDAASEEEASGDGDESASGEAPPSGPTATTIDGEEVSLGGGGEATALFFMAGW